MSVYQLTVELYSNEIFYNFCCHVPYCTRSKKQNSAGINFNDTEENMMMEIHHLEILLEGSNGKKWS